MPPCGKTDAAYGFPHETARTEKPFIRLAANDPLVPSCSLIQWQELKVACRPGSGWAVASVSPDRIQAGSPQGAPAWVAKIQRIKSQD